MTDSTRCAHGTMRRRMLCAALGLSAALALQGAHAALAWKPEKAELIERLQTR